MKHLFISCLSVLCCAEQSVAQDLIVKNDSTKIRALVLEIYPAQLKYKLFDYPDGPQITENKDQIAYIVFGNGLRERFPKAVPAKTAYDPNAYNLDKVPVRPYDPLARQKKYEAFYQYKNYVGFNYIAFLNAAVGFQYMRDIRKAQLILQVPVAIGMGKPPITNGLYGRNYLDGMSTTQYERMNYQAGLSALFTPSMKGPVNFLLGPAFNFSEYRMSVNSVWTSYGQRAEFSNSFKLYRSHYGVNVGLMARYNSRFNMCLLLTMGYKQDRYSEPDPYGYGIRHIIYNNQVVEDNTKSYVNFSWTLGYRF